jgi:NADPH2:quinone reductase
MRALVCSRWCEFKDLTIEDIPPPALAPGTVRVRVAHASLSFALTLMVAGKYQNRSPLPFVPGKELTGVVTAIANDVRGVQVGDRVVAIAESGAFAEEAVAHAKHTYVVPSGVPLLSALPLPLSYGTAYTALVWRARLQPGETLLVHGAAGGTGLAAVQIGRQLGARVIATASTEDKRAFLRAQGVAAALPSDAFREEVKALTGGAGANVIYDPVGGRVFDESLRCAAPECRMLVIGFAGGTPAQIPANLLLVKDVTVMGFYFGRYTGGGARDESDHYAPALQEMMTTLFAWTRDGRISPIVAQTFPLEQFREGMDLLLARKTAGKIALRIGNDE